MASSQDFVDYVTLQMKGAGLVTARKMFGEYGVYCEGKMFAVVCDNKLYIKPTVLGRKWIKKPVEAAPYPGAKLYFLIEDKLDDHHWLAKLAQLTVNELPLPKKREKSKAPQKARILKNL